MFWPFIMDSGYVGLPDIMLHFDLDIDFMNRNFVSNFFDTLSTSLPLWKENQPFNIGFPSEGASNIPMWF